MDLRLLFMSPDVETKRPILPWKFAVNNTFVSGARESGKSTFLKQMDILYGKPWSREKKTEFRSIIFKNTIDAMKTILTDGFRTLGENNIPEELQVPAC